MTNELLKFQVKPANSSKNGLSENEEELSEDLASRSKHEVSDDEEEASTEVKPKKPQASDHEDESPAASKICFFIKITS